jgi:KDO2-lipid IV(A) lauroyltransferase
VRSTLHTIETFLAKLALAVVPRLSRGGVLRLARVLGRAACAFSRHLRQVGRTNLEIAFGHEMAAEERERILVRSFQSFALALLDTFWFAHKPEERVERLVRFAPEFEALFQAKAQICITAHLGNWEVLGMAFSFRGYPLTSVAAPLENEAVDALFNRLRKATGQRVVSKHGALRPLLRTLKDGDKVALVLDQNTKPSEGGLFVDFFGKAAPVSSAAAALSLRTGAEVFVGACIPQADGSYYAPPPEHVPAPEPGAHEAETLHIFTQRITSAVEQLVRSHPEHWLWSYKRWKYVAPGSSRDEYPFYAKELPKSEG